MDRQARPDPEDSAEMSPSFVEGRRRFSRRSPVRLGPETSDEFCLDFPGSCSGKHSDVRFGSARYGTDRWRGGPSRWGKDRPWTSCRPRGRADSMSTGRPTPPRGSGRGHDRPRARSKTSRSVDKSPTDAGREPRWNRRDLSTDIDRGLRGPIDRVQPGLRSRPSTVSTCRHRVGIDLRLRHRPTGRSARTGRRRQAVSRLHRDLVPNAVDVSRPEPVEGPGEGPAGGYLGNLVGRALGASGQSPEASDRHQRTGEGALSNEQ